jgi:hypothetical protein
MMNTMTSETNEYMNDRDTTRVQNNKDTLNTDLPENVT